jgi:hypothetical protein
MEPAAVPTCPYGSGSWSALHMLAQENALLAQEKWHKDRQFGNECPAA